MKRVFKRKIYDTMKAWKDESKGRTALLVEGARRVGKSTIVEEFARNEYQSHIIIDFNKTSKEIKALFDDIMDLDRLFIYLQATYHVALHERKSVIVFDEVQNCPMARQAIKYLVADGRYDYIETGSLISIRQNTEKITIPSEERRIQMNPMDYEEFRRALGDDASVEIYRTMYDKKMKVGAALRSAMRDLRMYMLVGGMPQAVNELLDTNELRKVDDVKRSIIDLYHDDLLKIDPTGAASRVFLSIPSQLSRNANKYAFSAVAGATTDNRALHILRCLEQSKIANVAYNVTDPGVGMALSIDSDCFKIYTADTGLFITLAFRDKSYTENVIYQKLLSDKLDANLGYVYENLVAQMLVSSGNNLFYHTWAKDAKHAYEIDFLLSRGKKIVPVEVKSSGYKTHASLDAFCTKYASRVGDRYLIYTKDYDKDGETTYLPAF
ncbi:MAG: ATP-binding protein, partial [Muribaculaceae bacterium]